MKGLSFFSGSGQKRENKRPPVARAMPFPDPPPRLLGSSVNVPDHPSLELNGSGDCKTIHESRIFGKRAFSRSTSRLSECPASEDVPLLTIPTREVRKSSVFRRPRFAIFRDSPPTQDRSLEQESQKVTHRRSLSLSARKVSVPKCPVASNVITIPPVPPLPPSVTSICQSQDKSVSPFAYPSSFHESFVPDNSLAETRKMSSKGANQIAGLKRRSRSFADTETLLLGKKSMPQLDMVWQGFLKEVEDDVIDLAPSVPRLHPYDASLATSRAGTQTDSYHDPPAPWSEFSPETPGIVLSSPPLPSHQPSMQYLSPPSLSGPPPHVRSPSPVFCETSLVSRHSTSAKTKVILDPSPCSSEISLSLFPLPPSCDSTHSPRTHVKTYHTMQPRPHNILDYTPPTVLPVPPDGSDGEPGTISVSTRMPPLVKGVRVMGQSTCSTMTEELSEHSVSLFPSIAQSKLRSPWRGPLSRPQAKLFKFDSGIVRDPVHGGRIDSTLL